MPKTTIEWTDKTWNPVRGCSRVSAGCMNCYAEKVAFRFKGDGQPYEGLLGKGGQWNGQIKLVPEALSLPLNWRKPRKIFVNSMSDLFHENVPDYFIDRVFAVMAVAEQHTFQVLTKRPERMRDYMLGLRTRSHDIGAAILHRGDDRYYTDPDSVYDHAVNCAELGFKNVWLGVSVEDQKTADERIPLLLQTPAAVRWVSAEPLLGEINLCELELPSSYNITPTTPGKINCLSLDDDDRYYQAPAKLDWVVAGGESGSGARPMHPDWVRSLRDQCAAANVPFLFKQWGEWCPLENVPNDYKRRGRTKTAEWVFGKLFIQSVQFDDPEDGWCDEPHLYRIGKTKAGRLIDEVLHDDYPVIKESAHA